LLNKGGFLKTTSRFAAVVGFWLAILCLPTAALGQATSPDAAATTFKSKCAICHGHDGAGKTAMGEKFKIRDLRSADVQSQSDAELTQIITKGKEKMPSYDGKLTKEQIEQMVAYVRELGKKK
jgi:cytochrome c6